MLAPDRLKCSWRPPEEMRRSTTRSMEAVCRGRALAAPSLRRSALEARRRAQPGAAKYRGTAHQGRRQRGSDARQASRFARARAPTPYRVLVSDSIRIVEYHTVYGVSPWTTRRIQAGKSWFHGENHFVAFLIRRCMDVVRGLSRRLRSRDWLVLIHDGYPTIRDIRRLFHGIWIYLDHTHQLSVSTRWQNGHYPINPDCAGANRMLHALPICYLAC